ncbi:Mhp operon transcriptional activator [Klebsiella michiganensis]|nr:Mhp operon transcriptional activator [Klebsiella michiganensis]
MVVRETTHRFSRLSFHRAMVGRRLPLLLTASGLTWLAFAPEHERSPIVEMLAARPEAEYQLAREPEKLAAILERTRQNGYGENFRGLAAGGENRFHCRPHSPPAAGYRLPEPGLYG